MSWQNNIKAIMAKECLLAYRNAGNKPGRKHTPYALPTHVLAMRDALDKDDRQQGQLLLVGHQAKPNNRP